MKIEAKVEEGRQFWNDAVTRASWEALVKLAREYDVIVIGGWAVYLWTKAQKSKDIDVVAGFDTLEAMRKNLAVEKNERLRKYEVKTSLFDIDVYVPHYSRLAIAGDEIFKLTATVNGIKTLKPEALLLLKQKAELERRSSAKGRKDQIDLYCLLKYSGLDLSEYAGLARKNKLEKYVPELAKAIASIPDADVKYTGENFLEFKRSKKALLEKIKKA